jgi:hypothetical protein
MRAILCMAIAACGFGCASVDRIERRAAQHEAKAAQLEASGDFASATKEREAAAKQYSKANSRRGFEEALPIVYR